MNVAGRWGLLWGAVLISIGLVGSTLWVRRGIVLHESELAVVHGIHTWSQRDASLPLDLQFERLRPLGVTSLTRFDAEGRASEVQGLPERPSGRASSGPVSLHRGLYQMETEDGDGSLVMEFRPLLAGDLRSRADKGVVLAVASSGLLILFVTLWTRHRLRLEELNRETAHTRHLAHLGTLSAVIAHELRNPLTVLLGHVQLVREDLPDDESLQFVESSAVRLNRLLDSLLRFARTGALTRTMVEPRALLEQKVSGLDGRAVQVEGDAPTWSLDEMRMGQVLDNLLSNARTACPDGEVVARVRVDDDHLVFEVQDEGDGIPPRMHEAVFEPFHTTRVQGTGLGLSVARDIVEKHGGTLVAEDAPIRGALFVARIPRTLEVP